MRTIRATDDLILEVWPECDRPLVKLRSLVQERDGETPAGTVIIWPEEIRHLVAALVEAAGCLVEEKVEQWRDN